MKSDVMNEIAKLSDQDAFNYVISHGSKFSRVLNLELTFSIPDAFLDLYNISFNLDLLPSYISSMNLSDAISSFLSSDDLREAEYIKQLYQVFLREIGAADYADALSEAIDLCVLNIGVMTNEKHEILYDKLLYNDHVIEKIGGYFKRLAERDEECQERAYEPQESKNIAEKARQNCISVSDIPLASPINSDEHPDYRKALDKIEQCRVHIHETLDLQGLCLTALPPELFDLTHLKSLSLSSNALRSLPPEIGRLTELVDLDVSANEITTVAAEIGNLQSLKTLTFEYNLIESLPAEIGRLRNLLRLDLSSNPGIVLPQELAQLTSLEVLELRWNQLGYVPLFVCQLTNLKELILWENQFTELSSAIGNLTALTLLDLRGNSLETLPTEIGQLINLIDLNLFSNQIRSLPCEITGLSKLTSLNVACNGMNVLIPKIAQIKSLEILDLSCNNLSELPITMRDLTELKELYLHDNPLLEIPDEVLGPESDEFYDPDEEPSPANPLSILDYYFHP